MFQHSTVLPCHTSEPCCSAIEFRQFSHQRLKFNLQLRAAAIGRQQSFMKCQDLIKSDSYQRIKSGLLPFIGTTLRRLFQCFARLTRIGCIAFTFIVDYRGQYRITLCLPNRRQTRKSCSPPIKATNKHSTAGTNLLDSVR